MDVVEQLRDLTLENKALRAENRVLRAYFDLAWDGLLLVEFGTHVIVRANARAGILFGVAASELVGRAVRLLVPPESRDRHDAFIATFEGTPAMRLMGGGRRRLEALRQDGSEGRFAVEIGLTPIVSEGVTLAAIRDVSWRD